MRVFEDWPSVLQAVREHYEARSPELSPELQASLTEAYQAVSPPERCGKYCEALYGSAPLIGNEDREVCGGVAHFLGHPDRALWGMQVDNRGPRIFAAMRRRNGEPDAEQPESDDPQPMARYALAVE